MAQTGLYGEEEARAYLSGAPHLRHRSLRALYRELVDQALAAVGTTPTVLDLGAGEGSATLPFLEQGAVVTVVDDSRSQLDRLERRLAPFADRLTVLNADSVASLDRVGAFDVVVLSSFVHHVPDYLTFIGRVAAGHVTDSGVLLTFQDPLLHAGLSRASLVYSKAAYAAWRLRQPDVVGGAARRLRRARGVWDETCAQDVIEYHATRGGVDSDAIVRLLATHGFETDVVRYFSTQSPTFQRVGRATGLVNTFALLARRAGHAVEARTAATNSATARS